MKQTFTFILLVISAFSVSARQKAKTSGQPSPAPVAANTTGKDVVAIYHFTIAREYGYDFAVGVGNAVEAGFVRSSRFTVVERNRFGAIREEDKFREANTSDLVSKASKLGAKTIVTGHIAGISHGDIVDYSGKPTGREYREISLSFKIIDVTSGQIKKSEMIRGRGEGENAAQAMQQAYVAIDQVVRRQVASYLPQTFKFMSIVSKGIRKKQEYLNAFKIWGGQENGLKIGDVVDLYLVNYLINPNNNQRVEEKQLIAQAAITEINSGSTATCTVVDGSRKGTSLLTTVESMPDKIIIEFKGSQSVSRRTFMDEILGK